MKRTIFVAIVVLHHVLVASAQTTAIDLKGKTLAATFGELLPGFSAADTKLRTDAQQRWQDICFRIGAPENEKLRAEACTLMTAKLDASTPAAARLWLLTQLERLAREESVEALTALLAEKDDEIREAAVRALTNNPSPKASLALVKSLASATGTAKVGLLNALGHRGDAAAVEAIARELNGDDDSAIAAARALGRIPNRAAVMALIRVRLNAKDKFRATISNAMLFHADRLMAERNLEGAERLYVVLDSPTETRAIRLAALRGTIRIAGDKAGGKVLEILAGDNAAAKAIAVGLIGELHYGAIQTLAVGLDKLPAPSRVLAITAIAARGDRSLLSVALNEAKSGDTDVRRAGLHAIGRLGDASVVDFLLNVMSSDESLGRVAAENLARLAADGVDEKLNSVLAKQGSAQAVAIIGILERRKAVSSVPALLVSANGSDAAVRTAAFAALKSLASPEDARAMVMALLKTEKGREREQAELAIAAVCRQNPNPEQRAEPVLAAIKESNDRAKDLLPLLGRIGGRDSLKLVRDSLAASDPGLRTAAYVALGHWPDAAANDDLLAVAEKEKEPADRLSALKALIRINTTRVDRTPDERLAAVNVIKKTMPLTTRDDERRAILEGLANIRHIESLRFVLSHLDQPPLEQAACKGIVELAHNRPLREPNKAEFELALDRVIAVCKDKGLVERAKQYRAGR